MRKSLAVLAGGLMLVGILTGCRTGSGSGGFKLASLNPFSKPSNDADLPPLPSEFAQPRIDGPTQEDYLAGPNNPSSQTFPGIQTSYGDDRSFEGRRAGAGTGESLNPSEVGIPQAGFYDTGNVQTRAGSVLDTPGTTGYGANGACADGACAGGTCPPGNRSVQGPDLSLGRTMRSTGGYQTPGHTPPSGLPGQGGTSSLPAPSGIRSPLDGLDGGSRPGGEYSGGGPFDSGPLGSRLGTTNNLPGSSAYQHGVTPNPPGSSAYAHGGTPNPPGSSTYTHGTTPNPPGGSTYQPGVTPNPPGSNAYFGPNGSRTTLHDPESPYASDILASAPTTGNAVPPPISNSSSFVPLSGSTNAPRQPYRPGGTSTWPAN